MTLFFMHVTKTAGGTVKEMLRNSRCDVLFHYSTDPGFSREFQYKPHDVIYGHYLFGAHEKMGLPPKYACFFRDPVARVISHFNHLKNVDSGRIGDMARAHGSVEAFLSDARHWEMDNMMCRMLTGYGPKEIPFGGVNRAVYDLARRNMHDYFEFVGIFEDLHDSLKRLKRIIPGLNMSHVPTVNRGRYKPESQAVEAAIRESNTYDMMLYEDAVAHAQSMPRAKSRIASLLRLAG